MDTPLENDKHEYPISKYVIPRTKVSIVIHIVRYNSCSVSHSLHNVVIG